MPLTISSHSFLSPAGATYNYDTNVPVDYKIRLTFSGSLNASSISNSTIALVEIASDSILTGPDVVTIWDKAIGEGGAFKTNALLNPIPITWEVSGANLTITPSIALDPEKTYQLILTSGISSAVDYTATVLAETGSGADPIVEGVHSHEASHTLTITIATGGPVETATFNWTSDSGTYSRNGVLTSPYFQELSNWDTTPDTGEPGIFVKFGSGTYNTGDSWSFVLSGSAENLSETNIVQFTTVAQSTLVNVPNAEFPVIEPPAAGQRIIGGYSSATSNLSVTGFSIDSGSYNLAAPTTLTVSFNYNIDSTSISTASVRVFGDSIFSDDDIPSPGGAVISTAVLTSGNDVGITIDTTDIGDNNELRLNLAYSITSEGVTPSEVTLGTNQNFYFYTTFDPFYSTVDAIRLEFGALLDDITDLTLAKLIYIYSVEVDVLNTVALTGATFKQIAQQYVHCAVINQLIKGGFLDLPGGNSKSLGDLKFSNQISNMSLSNVLLKDTENCLMEMKTLLTAASNMTTVVRSDTHVDNPLVGRGWVNLDGYPGGPNYYLYRGSRRVKRGW